MSSEIPKRRDRVRVYFVSALALVGMLAVSSAIASRHKGRFAVETLSPIPTPLGISGRKLYRIRGSECVVLRPPTELVSQEEQQRFSGIDLEATFVRQEFPPGSPWHIEPNRPEDQTTFNCATFAIGEVIGLSHADYLTPQAVSFTNGENPAHVLLQEFFDCVATFPLAAIQWDKLDTLASLRDHDVVVFATHGSNEEYVHLGKIVKRQGHNRMISKFGRGPIVLGTIQHTVQAYEGGFDEIRIYRRR